MVKRLVTLPPLKEGKIVTFPEEIFIQVSDGATPIVKKFKTSEILQLVQWNEWATSRTDALIERLDFVIKVFGKTHTYDFPYHGDTLAKEILPIIKKLRASLECGSNT